MTTTTQPMCMYCVHLHARVQGDRTRRCAAFPAGIPRDIWWEAGDHTVPRAGDNGIQFESDGRIAPARFIRVYPKAQNPPT